MRPLSPSPSLGAASLITPISARLELSPHRPHTALMPNPPPAVISPIVTSPLSRCDTPRLGQSIEPSQQQSAPCFIPSHNTWPVSPYRRSQHDWLRLQTDFRHPLLVCASQAFEATYSCLIQRLSPPQTIRHGPLLTDSAPSSATSTQDLGPLYPFLLCQLDMRRFLFESVVVGLCADCGRAFSTRRMRCQLCAPEASARFARRIRRGEKP